MTASTPKSRLMGLGVFLLPLLLVKGTALMVGQTPQGASASGTAGGSTPAGVIETYTPDWSLEQIAASHRVDTLRNLPFGESPLLHARRVEDVVIDPIDPRPTVIKPPNVDVKMILRSSRGNVALIDGKYYRTGDSLGDGWIIEDIDPLTRSVFIMHPRSSQEATLLVPMPR